MTTLTLADLLLKLLPYGAYSLEPDALHVLESNAWAEGLETADGTVEDLLEELFPSTATAALPQWETTLGIIRGSGDTLAERRAAILAVLRRRPSLNPNYLAEVLATLTRSTVVIAEVIPLFYGPAEYGGVYVDEGVFRFLAVLDRTEAIAADAHWERIQPVLNDLKPAHTEGVVCYDLALYDDAWSPYDHTCYGA